MPPHRISFQGDFGAHSHAACVEVFPGRAYLPCLTFEEAFSAVSTGMADRAMIPVENSVAGRVADIHHLMPQTNLFIIGEHFLRVHHQLLALPGVALETLQTITSHVHALGQCRKILSELKIKSIVAADTAGAARHLQESQDRTCGVIASRLAAELYGLSILRHNIEDEDHNTTRFLILSASPEEPESSFPLMTTFLFRVRNVPSALYKALGGFATNGVNMTKLESYQPEGLFSATEFYADIEGCPEDLPVRLALEELSFFSSFVKILGVYPASPFRENMKRAAEQ